MTDETLVTIEVDGKELKAKPGSMLIDVTDAAGIKIPRFCYHNKLSVSANCRMCLVEVEKVPKPIPACATVVMDGMKVKTRSPMALAAQKGTMEFLLINHPLDCPICDQGGECELQDVSLGYGSDVSRYVENKRVIANPDIGPLVATDMTRCIHCTRCVRFGAEIAGIREMGATGRGDHMKIGTYIEKSIDSEMSGNIIDLCPVGALTSKPFRFKARAWELSQAATVAPHDSIGSNLYVHTRRNQLMRVVPRNNEAVNECWISDRDRFGYEALFSKARLQYPMIKANGSWKQATWDEALKLAADKLQLAGSSLKTLVSANSTLEELYLAQKLTRALGSNDIDHRLRQSDFRNDGNDTLRWLGMTLSDIEQMDAVLVIGGNPRREQPILGHRLRKAVMAGATVTYLNPTGIALNFEAQQLVETPAGMVRRLAAIAKDLGLSGGVIDEAVSDDISKVEAERLKSGDKVALLLGNMAAHHPDFAVLESLTAKIAEVTGARFGHALEFANGVGAQLAGAASNRQPGGKPADNPGRNYSEVLKEKIGAALLVGIDPMLDTCDPSAVQRAFSDSNSVVALTAFRTPGLDACANVMLPIGWFAETSGTYINAQGDWQTVAGAVPPIGETRPGWKVLRVLGNMTDREGFEYTSSEQVLSELRGLCGDVSLNNAVADGCLDSCFKEKAITRIGEVPLYASDIAVRHAESLQQTKDAKTAGNVRLNSTTANMFELLEGGYVTIKQDGAEIDMILSIDDGVPDDCAVVPIAVPESVALGPMFGEISLGND